MYLEIELFSIEYLEGFGMKKLGLFVLIIILALGTGVIIKSCFIGKGGSDIKAQGKEIVSNNEWNSSVYQVKDYLKNHLSDWDSYESVEWSPVRKVAASNYDYVVRHKYIAKNGFGGSVVSNQTFYLDAKGVVVNVEDYK